MLKKKLLAEIILLFFIFAGCATKPVKSGQTFVDALGREVTVSGNITRAAALLGSFADVWQNSGGEVAACPEDGWEDFDLNLENAVNLGNSHSPSAESVIASNPDIVLASASTASNVKMCETLQNAGITVMYFEVNNFDDYLNMLKVCTDITGRADLYEQNGIKIKNEIEKIKKDFQNSEIPEENKKVLLLRVSAGFIKAKGSEGTILGEMLYDLGCENIADSDSTLLENLSTESIIKSEPYHIFAVTMGDDVKGAEENLFKMLKENRAFSSLGAVENGRVHLMDKKLFNIKPNVHWSKAYEKLCEIFCEK